MADAATETAKPADPKKTVPRWRRILCAVLVVLGCVLAPLAVHAVWIHDTLLNTDQYVSTVGPLAGNPAVQDALANRVTNTLINGSQVESRVKNALPPKASFIAPFVANGLAGFVHTVALKLVQSPKFEQLWTNLNRRVHTRLVDVLRGQGKFVNNQGQVAINIEPVIQKVNAKLTSLGINGLSKAASQNSDQVVLFSSSTLASVQGGVRGLDDLAIALPILSVLLFAGAILVSGNRRRTVFRAGLGLALATLVFLTIWNVARSPYLSALPASVSPAAAGAVYDQLLSFLLTALRALFAFAVIVALGAWLAGPGRFPTRIRAGARSLVSRTPGQSAISPKVSGFVTAHRTSLRLLIVGLGLVVLVLLSHPGPWAVVVIAIIVLLLLGVLELLGRTATSASDQVGAAR